MEEAKFIFMDGEFVQWKEAKVHVLSHVVQYGSGVFEGIRTYETENGPAIFRAYDHYKRFKESMKIYRMEIGYSIEELISITKELITKNELSSAYIRPVAYRGYGAISPNPANVPVNLAIAAFPLPPLYGEGILKGISIMVSSWRKFAPDTIPSTAKANGNYLNSELAMMEAHENGYDEAVMLDFFGFVAEGPGENIFLVKDGVLYTPSIASSLLKGITRDSVIKIAASFGIKVVEERIPRELLYSADELFFCGTAAEITPIVSVDKISVSNGEVGEVTKRISDAFKRITKGVEDPFGWLEYVEFKGL